MSVESARPPSSTNGSLQNTDRAAGIGRTAGFEQGANEQQAIGVASNIEVTGTELRRDPREVTREQIEKAVNELNAGTTLANKQLSFQFREDVDRMMVRVIDSRTQEVIKELPPASVLEAAAKLRAFIGLLLDERV